MPDVDPLTVLNRPIEAVTPRPEFAARLRARLVAALTPTEGDPIMTITDTPAAPTLVPRAGALPYLAVADARAAIEFYRTAFAAELVGDPYVMGDGRIGHAELAMGGGMIYLADEFPDIGVTAPRGEGASVSLMIEVTDTDASVQRIQSAGGRVVREAAENYGSRAATVIDPFGHRWMVTGPITTPAPAAEVVQPGDLGYISVWTPDADRAARFYGHVLGWSYDTDAGPSRHVREAALSTGIFGGQASSTLFTCFTVADIDAASARIRELGGTADEPDDESYGRTALCTAPDGQPFAVWQAVPGATRPALNGAKAGELSYVTYETSSTGIFRDFFGALFGWTFTPGRVEDGWNIDGAYPMSGVHRGDHPGVTPMWLVEDVERAAERVDDAGGEVLDGPSQQPYGLSAYCADDQGGRFYLYQP